MGGNKKGKKRASASASGNTVWCGAEHAMRQERHMSKQAQRQDAAPEKEQKRVQRRERLTTKLTHDSKQKRESSKLRLNITKTQRDIEKLRKRLQQWDDVEEKTLLEKQEKDRQKMLEPKKKKGRLGPETWKLKGAARPAWQVNEFDVRYQCPHIKAHDDAKARARRIRNLLAIHKGSFGHAQASSTDKLDISYPHRRQLLALLMQFGLLNQEAKKYKTARVAFLECLELDGVQNPITDVRCRLMRLYLEVNRPQSVHQLWTLRLAPAAGQERSVWVLYSVALVEFVRWKDFEESSRLEAEEALVRAIQGNVYCAYYLAFADFFHKCMEFTDEINDAGDDCPLEEAIEYCDSEQMGMWIGTDGALEWLQNTLLRTLHGQQVANGALTKADLEWKRKLGELEKEVKAQKEADQEDEGEEDDMHSEDEGAEDGSQLEDERAEAEEEVDTLMYAGMFRTTMEMLEANGSFAQAPLAIIAEEKLVESQDDKQKVEGDESDNNESA